ncbi:hypothetical protein GWR56_18890 [Mucilaginibacter sp. 14171R-50]|uniref:hypothetical protein n=1 Tax=Mucilaginibacter sp. 14171R-50 TaxID=2703789 RepID=UPI00138CFE40|nr:hypothetical protein [Mucilaginibacter sp. 14171R-50]QHS57511.1 hypothetical protein GWR56_18890 [Mucilaginibacter sp. 14171R-50]
MLGPWSEGKKISDNSRGGQPSFVSTIKLGSGNVYLFGSDLWNNAAKNEALANYYWAPLTFNADGSIIPLTCDQPFKVTGSKVVTIPAMDSKKSSVKGVADIARDTKRSQTFFAERSGVLKTIYLPAYKTGTPDADLQVDVYRAGAQGNPVGKALVSKAIPANAIGWSVKRQVIHPAVNVTKGTAYCIVLSSATNTGSYGFTYDNGGHQNHQMLFGKLQAGSLLPENGKQLNFSPIVTPILAMGK